MLLEGGVLMLLEGWSLDAGCIQVLILRNKLRYATLYIRAAITLENHFRRHGHL